MLVRSKQDLESCWLYTSQYYFARHSEVHSSFHQQGIVDLTPTINANAICCKWSAQGTGMA